MPKAQLCNSTPSLICLKLVEFIVICCESLKFLNTKTTDKPVFSDHIKQDIFLAFQTGGTLLLHESS